MALSEQQKALNKAASAAKRRAHAARYKLLEESIAAAESSPDVLEAKGKADAARLASESALADRDRRTKELREQIRAIELQIEEVKNESAVQDSRAVEDSAWRHWRKLKDEKVSAAESAFPDMAGQARYYMAAWSPPPDVQKLIDEAASKVLGK